MTNDQKLAMIQLFGIKASYYAGPILDHGDRQLQGGPEHDYLGWVRYGKNDARQIIGFDPINWDHFNWALRMLSREDLEWLVHDEQ